MNNSISKISKVTRRKEATTCVRAGLDSDRHHGAVVPPLHLTSTYSFAEFGQPRQYDYSRSGNPTRDLLSDALCELEGGAGGVITASGMAAVTLVCQLLECGQRVLAPHDCYGGTHRLLTHLARRGEIEVDFVDQSDSAALKNALALGPAMVWIETPSNPLLRVVDIESIASAAREVGALVVVDNTFLSPHWQQPLELGADIVVHSTTKYLNGHSDVVGGAAIARVPDLAERLRWWANCLGLTAAPFDCFLTLRGLRTLPARMRLHEENAQRLVDTLCRHPAVARVHYPALEHHPGAAIARRQQTGFGAMVSFELHNGERGVRALLNGLQCFSLAESLGGVESLIAHPATMTHAAMAPDARQRAGIGDGLLRLSVGIEDIVDLGRDLNAGLDRAGRLSREKAHA